MFSKKNLFFCIFFIIFFIGFAFSIRLEPKKDNYKTTSSIFKIFNAPNINSLLTGRGQGPELEVAWGTAAILTCMNFVPETKELWGGISVNITNNYSISKPEINLILSSGNGEVFYPVKTNLERNEWKTEKYTKNVIFPFKLSNLSNTEDLIIEAHIKTFYYSDNKVIPHDFFIKAILERTDSPYMTGFCPEIQKFINLIPLPKQTVPATAFWDNGDLVLDLTFNSNISFLQIQPETNHRVLIKKTALKNNLARITVEGDFSEIKDFIPVTVISSQGIFKLNIPVKKIAPPFFPNDFPLWLLIKCCLFGLLLSPMIVGLTELIGEKESFIKYSVQQMLLSLCICSFSYLILWETDILKLLSDIFGMLPYLIFIITIILFLFFNIFKMPLWLYSVWSLLFPVPYLIDILLFSPENSILTISVFFGTQIIFYTILYKNIYVLSAVLKKIEEYPQTISLFKAIVLGLLFCWIFLGGIFPRILSNHPSTAEVTVETVYPPVCLTCVFQKSFLHHSLTLQDLKENDISYNFKRSEWYEMKTPFTSNIPETKICTTKGCIPLSNQNVASLLEKILLDKNRKK